MTTVVTRVPDGDNLVGRDRWVVKDYTLSGTYAALVINASDVGLRFFKAVDAVGGDISLATYFPVFDYGTSPAGTSPTSVTLRLYTASGVVASGTLSPTVNIRLQFIGQ